MRLKLCYSLIMVAISGLWKCYCFLTFVRTINPHDPIYDSDVFAASPVVIESHKLIFFNVQKVGCTVWKKLFRRMMGYPDWKTANPHNRATNGLILLSDLNLTFANHIMESPEWTRAIVLRDPKERFLSAYLDKVHQNNGTHFIERCCPDTRDCLAEAQTFEGFFERTQTCEDHHWIPYTHRMSLKHFDSLDFVGHMESIETDSRALLQRIGAWEQYGATGWGRNGDEPIFGSSSSINHATSASREDSWGRLSRYYTPEMEARVEERFQQDYNLQKLNLTLRKIEFAK